MSDGNRRYFATIGGIGLAVILVATVPFACTVADIQFDRNRIQQRTECQSGDAAKCATESNQADIRAANAAEYSLDLTVVQGLLNVLGLIGLIATVIFAHRAWEEARKSAKIALDTLEDARRDGAAQANRFLEQMAIATRSAEAATAQIEIANKAYITENRPWVGLASEAIKSLGLRDGRGPRAELVFEFSNSGRTPAHELSLDALLLPDMSPDKTVAEIERRFRARPRRFADDYLTTLLPGETYKFEFSVNGSPDHYRQIPADSEGVRDLIFTIGGFVIYKSKLGDPQTHLTSFVYRVMLRGNQPVRWGGASELFDADQILMKRWPKGWLAD